MFAPHSSRSTIIASASYPRRHWESTDDSKTRVTVVNSTAPLFEILAGEQTCGTDVERVIVDRTATATEFLHLVVAAGENFAGDLLMIREDGSGFLSADGRGGSRVLYGLSADDVAFYLLTTCIDSWDEETLGLTA